MRRSIRLLLFAVVIPGALSPVLWAALVADGEPELEVEVREVEPLRVKVVPSITGIEAEKISTIVVSGVDGECRHARTETRSIGASAEDRLALRAGSGELEVEGRPGLDAVRVTARMCASEEDFLDDMAVELDRMGDELRVDTEYPHHGGGHGRYARIHLTVEVPEGIAVDIRDSSGSMELSRLGALRIDDSSGDIDVRSGLGPVFIDDGSGGIDVDEVAGDVEIEDGSGSVDVTDVTGSVVLSDGSGSVEIAEISGDVRVRDGSGSIVVSSVGGDFVVENDGSGSIRHSGVQGRIDVPDEGR